MEYTIDNETLVYYALRNPVTGHYLKEAFPNSLANPNIMEACTLKDCYMFSSIGQAERIRDLFPDYSEIRKVKIIDIGNVEDN